VGVLSSLLALFGCGKAKDDRVEQQPPTDPRKERTEVELRKLGIPVNPWLPLVESEDEARIRDAKDVARRVLILYGLTAVGQDGGREQALSILRQEGLWEYVSPAERRLLENANPSQQALTDASWRMEAVWVLLWALGKVDDLDLPTGVCDSDHLHQLMPKPDDCASFISSAQLRPVSELLDETDRIYRIHWAVRDAQINKRPIPAGLDPDVVVERHYALNWLTWYADDWDDITTDT